jgi:hypothetical protein
MRYLGQQWPDRHRPWKISGNDSAAVKGAVSPFNSGNSYNDIHQGRIENCEFSQFWLTHSFDRGSVTGYSTCHNISIRLTDRQLADNTERFNKLDCSETIWEKSNNVADERCSNRINAEKWTMKNPPSFPKLPVCTKKLHSWFPMRYLKEFLLFHSSELSITTTTICTNVRPQIQFLHQLTGQIHTDRSREQ